jgi:hypothetical protein
MNPEQKATGQAPAARHREHSEAFDEDLEWFILCGSSAMGARGTLGGVVAVLEHGGQFTGMPNSDLYSDQQVGFGPTVIGLVERHRWLSGAWDKLPRETQGVLLGCYSAPRAQHRTDETSRSGAEAQLGRFAALAFWLTKDPAKLLGACREPQKGGNSKVIAAAVKAAKAAAVEAHVAWVVAKGGAVKPRRTRERRFVLKAFIPGSDPT